MKSWKYIGLFCAVMIFSMRGIAQNDEVVTYVEEWNDVAVNQMVLHGIPASITLAQGILESGYGKSKLAVRANNHFGIKCHGWKGENFYHDDDKKDECFRKYESASDSYEDHSLFLTSRSRYDFLFDLDVTDYKAWSKGLKKAGYATNPKYHKKLITLIEKYDLDEFDEKGDVDWVARKKEDVKNEDPNGGDLNAETTKHKVYYNPNKTKYILARNTDTFYQIAEEFGLNIRQLHRWNDFPPTKDLLEEGDKVYVMRKRKKSTGSDIRVRVEQDKPLWEISQEHGVQLATLMKLNDLSSPETSLTKGEVVFLK
ncbi:MAG: glucosaminidase domain-containing protein [Bacteroidota bacterium]